MLTRAIKPKVCRHCKAAYQPMSSTAKACSVPCALALAGETRAKAEKVAALADRKDTRAKLEAIKSRSQWAREAQAVANRYARVRDRDDGCISCSKPSTWPGQWHGSHFRSVGAASAVRFNLWNIHKACSVCNNYLSGNVGAYAPRLVEKIGQSRVDWLLAQNQVTKHSIEFLKKYKRVIGKRVKRMEKSNAV